MEAAAGVERRRDLARRHPALLVLVGVLALVMFALPSALNLPQANPGEVAEYAPVPGSSSVAPSGNLAGLGLGESAGPGGGAGLPPQPAAGAGRQPPAAKDCVGNPPRQTEDLLSPPCVPYFAADNGGSTYQGVTRSTITVVDYVGCYLGNAFQPTSEGNETEPCNETDDADRPISSSDFLYTRALKAYMAYFNFRYQTYNRHVHLLIHYGSPGSSAQAEAGNGCDDPCLAGDAQTDFNAFHPFAVIADAPITDVTAYELQMVKRQVMDFGGETAHEQSYYQQFAPLMWSYAPSIEQRERLMSSFLCQKIVGRDATFAPEASLNGKTRVFGMVYQDPNNPAYGPQWSEMVAAVKSQVASCGGSIKAEHTAEYNGTFGGNPSDPSYQEDLVDFQHQGVTTIIWLGLPDGWWSKAADQLGYMPEWIADGFYGMDDFITGRYSDQTAWKGAIVISQQPLVTRLHDEPCYQALSEFDPSYSLVDLQYTCYMYAGLRQLFTGIQVAGPRLSPSTVERGMYAIPAVASIDPQVPACFYPTGDYTCVKDAVALYWDPNGQTSDYPGQGCYRDPFGGRRFLPSEWPSGDPTRQEDPAHDPCNGFTAAASTNPWTGTPEQ
jgi:hypothetical protein